MGYNAQPDVTCGLTSGTTWKHWHSKQASNAAFQNDFRRSYQIVRMLGGAPFKHSQVVSDKHGNAILNPEDAKLRWQEHFVEVFGARIIAEDKLETTPPSLPIGFKSCEYTYYNIEEQVWKLGQRIISVLSLFGLGVRHT